MVKLHITLPIYLNTAFSFDHVAFNDADQGKHNRTTMFVNNTPITSAPNTANIFLTDTPQRNTFAWVRESSSTNILFGNSQFTGFDNEGWYAITKGDNNVVEDNWKVRFEQIEGIVIGIIY